MGQTILKYTGKLLLLVLFQVVILNQIRFSGYMTPYVYVAFILLLPLNFPKTGLLILAFILGIIMDSFSDSLGMHTSACLFMAFLKPTVINIVSGKREYGDDISPTIKNMGIRWVIFYTFLMVFLHHLFLFFIEIFSFREFFSTITRAFLSSLFSTLLLIIGYFIFEKSTR